MNPATRHPARLLAVLASLAIVGAACGATTPSTQPSLATLSPSPDASGSVPPSAVPTPTPVPSTSAEAACPIAAQTGRLPSDRLVDIVITGGADADLITFVFGNDSLPGSPTAPEGTLETAEPPFTHGSSGLPIEVDGDHAALVRFAGMSVANDVGQPVYEGATEIRPDLPAVRHVVNMEMFEGVVGWYIGYDGPGCMTLDSDGQNVSIAIAHSAS